MVNLPFVKEEDLDGEVREFLIDRDDEEYVWHRDNEHREVEILEGEGWRFQYENCLPYLFVRAVNCPFSHLGHVTWVSSFCFMAEI